jgi:hypothetical protein
MDNAAEEREILRRATTKTVNVNLTPELEAMAR